MDILFPFFISIFFIPFSFVFVFHIRISYFNFSRNFYLFTFLISSDVIYPISVDFVIPQKGESLLGAYEKWRQWADEKGMTF